MLLDTCALLWLASGDRKLSQGARRRIEDAPAVYVSAITGFEIGIKCARRKLRLPASPEDWIAAVLQHHQIAVAPVGLDACLAAARLPAIHGDPCDRFIIATAKLNDWPVVTADRVFDKYDIEVVW